MEWAVCVLSLAAPPASWILFPGSFALCVTGVFLSDATGIG